MPLAVKSLEENPSTPLAYSSVCDMEGTPNTSVEPGIYHRKL